MNKKELFISRVCNVRQKIATISRGQEYGLAWEGCDVHQD